jgi:putative endonuclease
MICFVEVKAREREELAAEAIGFAQRGRIIRAAALYLGARPALRHKGVRFDAILVMPRRLPLHVREAWRP